MAIDPQTTSSYLKDLPAIFSDHPFLGHFLLAFEQVLTGLPDVPAHEAVPALGLEEIIARMSTLFDPKASWDAILPEQERQTEFLQWLAGWVALGLRADWTDAQKREFLAKVVSLYRKRGTEKNLVELLRIYTIFSPIISGTEENEFQIRDHSTIGVDTFIGGTAPHFFRVSVTMPNPDPATLRRQREIATALIDLQKPAHTDYELRIAVDTMQIRDRSTIGVNTLLGNLPT
jgi:phage tail-like protein